MNPITPFLHELHWLKAAERIDYKLALFVYKCRQGAAPLYLADELREPADFEAQCRLRSASSSSLVIRRTQLSTVGDRAFPVAADHIWNSLPQHVTSVQSLPVFHSRLRHISSGAARSLINSAVFLPVFQSDDVSAHSWNALPSTLRDIADCTRFRKFSKHTSSIQYLSFLPYAFCNACLDMYVRQAIELRVLLLLLFTSIAGL